MEALIAPWRSCPKMDSISQFAKLRGPGGVPQERPPSPLQFVTSDRSARPPIATNAPEPQTQPPASSSGCGARRGFKASIKGCGTPAAVGEGIKRCLGEVINQR